MIGSMDRGRERVAIVLAVAIFASLSIAGSLTSEGFLEADACTHYLYARFAFEHPHFFVNIWGRPICTGIYALPAAMAGRFGVHLTSLALALGCGLIAWRIAREQYYRWPALALIFTLCQPLVFLHSFSELTELPFAFLLILAFWCYQRRLWLLMAAIVAVTPLSRPEGFGFLVLAALALVAHRRTRWLLILPLPLLIWNHAGWILYAKEGHWWRWLIDQWPYSSKSLYKPGNLFHFVALMPAVVSPFVFPATCFGVWRCMRQKVDGQPHTAGRGWTDPALLVAAVPLMILIGHSVLYALGKMASSGEIRYMLIVAPFWGLLTARGWEWIFHRLGARRPLLWAGVAALLPIAFNAYYKVLPIVFDVDWKRAQRAVWWYRNSGVARDFPRIATAHQAIYYFLDVATTDGRHVVEWRKDVLASTPAGTLVLWHPMYSIYNSDANRAVPLEELLVAGWIDVTSSAPTMGPGWHILLSPKDAGGSDARETQRSLLPP